MKKIQTLLLLVFFMVVNHSVAFGQEAIHYVIALDCSGSMEKDGRSKKALISVENIRKKARPIDKFDIVCFAQKTTKIVHDTASCKIIPGENTCILNAWQEAEKLFKPEENVYFYLITDGEEDHDNNPREDHGEQAHNDSLIEKIMSFCSGERGDRKGFYENLVKTLNNSKKNPIYDALLKSDCFHVIANAEEWIIKEVEDFDKEKGGYLKIFDYNTDKDIINNVYSTTTDPYFNVYIRDNCIKNSKYELVVKSKKNVPDEIKRKGPYEFWVKIKSDENAKTDITPVSIKIQFGFYNIFADGEIDPKEWTINEGNDLDKGSGGYQKVFKFPYYWCVNI